MVYLEARFYAVFFFLSFSAINLFIKPIRNETLSMAISRTILQRKFKKIIIILKKKWNPIKKITVVKNYRKHSSAVKHLGSGRLQKKKEKKRHCCYDFDTFIWRRAQITRDFHFLKDLLQTWQQAPFHPCCDAATPCKYFAPDVFIRVILLLHLKQHGRTKIAADEWLWPAKKRKKPFWFFQQKQIFWTFTDDNLGRGFVKSSSTDVLLCVIWFGLLLGNHDGLPFQWCSMLQVHTLSVSLSL